MGRIINLDARKGGASLTGIVIGTVTAAPTQLRRSGSIIVLPEPEPFGLSNGKAALDLDPSPEGDDPSWVYKIVIRDEIAGRSVTEFVAVPAGAEAINYTELKRFGSAEGSGAGLVPMVSRGNLPDGADANDYVTSLHVGAWRLVAGRTYYNIPASVMTQSGTFEVILAGSTVKQQGTGHNEFWYRVKPTGAFGSWRHVPFAATGTLPDGYDLNELVGLHHAGIYHLDSAFTYVNCPPLYGASTLKVDYAGTNAVAHLIADGPRRISRESISTTAKTFSGWQESADAKTVPPSEFSQQLLNLAQADGWHAVYDPGNVASRSMNAFGIASLSDGLGNLPPATARTANWAPQLAQGKWGAISAGRYGINLGTSLRTGLLAELQQQPTFLLSTSQLASPAPSAGSSYIFDGTDAPDRNALFVTSNPAAAGKGWGMYAGSDWVTRDQETDLEPHVIGTLFNGPVDSRFYVDDIAQYVRKSGSTFAQNLNGLSLGNRYLTTEYSAFDGWIGPVLIYRGTPSNEVRQRMTRFLMAHLRPDESVDTVLSESAILITEGAAIPEYQKEAYTPRVPASITKVLTGYTARKTVTDAMLDTVVTISDSDGLTGSGTSQPRLYDGDQVTIRDLFYMLMLSSHNAAARIIARVVGDLLPGGGTGAAKFNTEMMANVTRWGWEGANFVEPSGLSTSNRMSPAQVAELMFRCKNEDPWFTGVMRARDITVKILGPNPRSALVNRSTDPNGNPPFPELVAVKTGTLTNIGGNIAILTKNGSGPYKCVVTMYVKPEGQRLADARNILDGNTASGVAPSVSAYDVLMSKIFAASNSMAVGKLEERFAPRVDPSDITSIGDNFPGADMSASGADIKIQRVSAGVEFTIAATKLPANGVFPDAIAKGYRPRGFAYGSCVVRNAGAVKSVEVTVRANGDVEFYGNAAGDLLRGTLTWNTTDPEPGPTEN